MGNSTMSLTLPLKDALYLVRAGHAATSRDEWTAPILTGILLSTADDQAMVVATDRYRVHRATVKAEGEQFGPVLLPPRAVNWVIKNATFFWRSSALVEPQLTITVDGLEFPEPRKAGNSTAVPSGKVTLTLAESQSETADRISVTTELIRGHFPGVSDLVDKALAADDVVDGALVDLEYIAQARSLARYQSESATMRSVPNTGESGPARVGQVLIVYPNGVALIQRRAS